MTVTYAMTTENGRLQAVVNVIDANGNGFLQLLAGGTLVSTIQLARPCAAISGGVMTFAGTLIDPSAANSGVIDGGRITDALGGLCVSGLTAGIPGGNADIVIANGLNTTFIAAGQTIQILSARITGN